MRRSSLTQKDTDLPLPALLRLETCFTSFLLRQKPDCKAELEELWSLTENHIDGLVITQEWCREKRLISRCFADFAEFLKQPVAAFGLTLLDSPSYLAVRVRSRCHR